MRRAALGLLLLAPPAWAAKKPFPASPPSYVYNEGVVSAPTEDRISRRLRGVEVQTGHQFVVALFQSLDGESLEDYTNRLFREWQIGSKKKDDGLLLTLFKDDRKWRVEVGYGLEGALTDLEASVIARDAGTSYLKAGDYDTAVFAMVDGLAAKLGSSGSSSVRIRPRRALGDSSWLLVAAVILFILYILCFAYESSRRSTISGAAAMEAGLDVLNIVFNILAMFGGGGGGGGSGGGFSGGGGSSGGGGASGDW